MPPYNAEPLLDMGIWMVRNGEYDIFLLFWLLFCKTEFFLFSSKKGLIGLFHYHALILEKEGVGVRNG